MATRRALVLVGGVTAELPSGDVLPRIDPVAGALGVTSGSGTPDFDTNDIVLATGLTGTTTFAAPTYTNAKDGDLRRIRIKSSSSSNRSLNWNSIYRGMPAMPLPFGTGTASLNTECLFQYNAADTKWDLVSCTQALNNLSVFDPSIIITEAETIDSNDSDAQIPTTAAVKDYVDRNDWTDVILGGDTTRNSGTVSSLLTFAPANNAIYLVRIRGTFSASATGVGVKIGLYLSGTNSFSGLGSAAGSAPGASNQIVNVAQGSDITYTAVNASATFYPISWDVMFATGGSAGTFEMRCGVGGSGTITFKQGLSLSYIRIA